MSSNRFRRPASSDVDQTATLLQQALTEHADGVEPRSDSYLTLSNRIDEVVASGEVVEDRFRIPPARFMAAAAMLVLVAGTVGVLATRVAKDDVTAIGPNTTPPAVLPTTTSTQVPPPTTEPAPPSSTTEPNSPSASLVTVPVASEVRGPVADSPTNAAAAFLALLDLHGEIDIVDTQTRVVELQRDGFVVAELDIAPVPEQKDDNGESTGSKFAVVRARSGGINIDRPPLGIISEPVLAVTGEGRGFEAHMDVTLRSALDGTVLSRSFGMGGCCEELLPYNAELNLSGAEVAWLVVSSDGAGSGQLTEFAAEPIVYETTADPTEYTVFRVTPADPDQGLNIRDLAGTDEGQVLDTLPPGTTGIRRLPRIPALVGESVWWEVTTADGLTGWAHSAFLAEQQGSDPAQLQRAAENVVFAIQNSEFPEILEDLPLSKRYKVAMGWLGAPKLIIPSNREVRTSEFWTSRRDWDVPEASFGEQTLNLSVLSFLNLPPDITQAELLVNAAQPYGTDQDLVDMYFPGTDSVTIIGPETVEGPWRNTVLFFEATRNGPELVGIVVSIQIP